LAWHSALPPTPEIHPIKVELVAALTVVAL
jgi:hypothetical protein